MKKSDEQERNIANRLYNLDKKVYETTGSTLGRVFPSSPSFALEKIIDALKINREYFLKNEMTLIANMIGTIRDEEKAAPLKQEYDELEKDILAYNPTIILPHSIDNNDAVASRRFSSDNHLIICISRQFGTGGHTIGFELAQRLGIAYYDKEIIHLACDRMGLNSKDVTDYGIDSSGSSRGILSSIGKASRKFFSTQSDMLFFTQSNLICEMATQESCIFMGRCADVVLTNNNIPHLSIFLSAPFKERVKYEMGIASCDYKTASAKVKTMDQERKNYYQYYTGRQWGYAGNYDLCVNTFPGPLQGQDGGEVDSAHPGGQPGRCEQLRRAAGLQEKGRGCVSVGKALRHRHRAERRPDRDGSAGGRTGVRRGLQRGLGRTARG